MTEPTIHPDTGGPAQRRPPALRRLAVAVAALFALATLGTGAVSLGQYCLTTDGGNRAPLLDGMALHGAAPIAVPTGEDTGASAPSGAACPRPGGATGAGGGSRGAAPATDEKGDTALSQPLESPPPAFPPPPVDRRPRGEIRAATFALG